MHPLAQRGAAAARGGREGGSLHLFGQEAWTAQRAVGVGASVKCMEHLHGARNIAYTSVSECWPFFDLALACHAMRSALRCVVLYLVNATLPIPCAALQGIPDMPQAAAGGGGPGSTAAGGAGGGEGGEAGGEEAGGPNTAPLNLFPEVSEGERETGTRSWGGFALLSLELKHRFNE